MSVAFDSNVNITVEIGFDASGPLDTTFTWTDVSAYVRGFDITRGRSQILDEDSAGTASVILDNADRRFDPGYATGAYNPNVKPGKPLRIQAVHNSITYDLWRGFTSAWPMSWPGQVDDVVVLTGVDAFQVFNLILLGNAEVQEASGTRIANILDEIGWPTGASWRDIDAGAFNVIAITWDCQSGMQALRVTTDSEVGRLFMTGAGVVRFNDSNWRGAATVQETFDDDGGASDVRYQDIQVGFDDAQIWNKVNVGRRNSTLVATADDATSQTAYGVRVLKINDSLLTDSTDATTVAQLYRDRFKDPKQYVSSLVVQPTRNQSVDWPAALGLELDEKVTVRRNAPGGGTVISLNQFIEGISHSARVDGVWTTTYTMSPE